MKIVKRKFTIINSKYFERYMPTAYQLEVHLAGSHDQHHRCDHREEGAKPFLAVGRRGLVRFVGACLGGSANMERKGCFERKAKN